MEEAELQEALNKFERCVLTDGPIAESREALRYYLYALAGTPVSGSTSEAVALLASSPCPSAAGAAVILRAIAHAELVRDNSNNQLNRHVVELAEKSLPNLCTLLGVQPKSQTFEKFEILRGTYDWIGRRLAPLRTHYTTIDSMLAAKAALLSALGHGRLSEFGAVYRLPEV